MKDVKENKIFYFIMLIMIVITLILILLVHIFNTSDESYEKNDERLTCPYAE